MATARMASAQMAILGFGALGFIALLAWMQERDRQAELELADSQIATMRATPPCPAPGLNEDLAQNVVTAADWRPARRYCIYVKRVASVKPTTRIVVTEAEQ